MTLKGRTALVTGAASGIGLAVAKDLAARGAEVILSDIPGDGLKRAAEGIERARGLPADLSNRDEVNRLIAEAGRVDILVNNAGLQHVSPVEEFDEAKWDKLIAVMLTAPFLMTRRFLPGMYERGWGRIVNVSSVHGLVASPFKSAYVSAKHGIIGFTKTVALEAGARCPQITVNAVCPSYVRTPLVEKQIADQAKVHKIPETEVVERIMLTQNAIKRLIEPSEVAECVAFLCKDEAWSITGTAFPMDAGWLAH